MHMYHSSNKFQNSKTSQLYDLFVSLVRECTPNAQSTMCHKVSLHSCCYLERREAPELASFEEKNMHKERAKMPASSEGTRVLDFQKRKTETYLVILAEDS